jgi:hypothetical protein
MDSSAWNETHGAEAGSMDEANERLGTRWHAKPEEEAPSSWDFRDFWALPPEKTVFATNLLIRFEVNNDPNHESLIPFQIGFPNAETIWLEIGSNIDGLERTVEIRVAP